MQMGLLWFDSDPSRDVLIKVKDAAKRYREKFGALPDTCYVNFGALSGEMSVRLEDGGGPALRVIPADNILAHHFWIGVEERRDRNLS